MDITINLVDDREAELVKLTNEHNKLFPAESLTPAQFLRQHVRSWIDISLQQRSDRDRLTLREAYKQATPAEQASIDAILAKYR